MPTVDVFNIAGEKVKELALDDSVFGCEVRSYLLHDVVLWQLANRRAASANTKTRAQVSGGGAKPWKQKGTGRARSGSNTSPVWRHGGVTFGPNNRNYKINLPKKVRKQALCSALSMKTSENLLKVVDAMSLEEPRTKQFVKVLGALGMAETLVVVGNMNTNVALASRNHPKSKVLDVRGLNVYDLLKYKGLVMDLEAIEFIEERLKQ
jgi:large subunit ribosomal protein L4